MNNKHLEEGLKSGVALANLNEVQPPAITEDHYWKEAGVVEKLYIYPVKSMRGISVEFAEVGKYGLINGSNVDRQYMIVTEGDMRMVTGRIYPRIVLISAFVDDITNTMTLSAPEMPKLIVEMPIDISETSIVNTKVFDKECHGFDMGDSVSRWLSQFILKEETGLRLITHWMPSMQTSHKSFSWLSKLLRIQRTNKPIKSSREYHFTKRPSLKSVLPFCRNDDVPLYADGFGFLLLAENSLGELNRRLDSCNVQDLVVEETRFRPNIFVSGTDNPFEEDSWLYIKIGKCLFRNTALCTRCVFTTVDPTTGEKHAQGEPLRTLKKFRSTLDPDERKVKGDSPFFGINLGVDICGTIRVGDKIFISQPIPKAQGWISQAALSKIPNNAFYIGACSLGIICAILLYKAYPKINST